MPSGLPPMGQRRATEPPSHVAALQWSEAAEVGWIELITKRRVLGAGRPT